MVNDFKELIKNIKSEIGAILILGVIYICKNFIPISFISENKYVLYFTQERLNGVAAFFAITIGVYITVITILATSEISITREMLIRKLDKSLINVMITGMVENFVSVAMAIFIPLNYISGFILIVFVTISMISFIKFVILLIVIFKRNADLMANSIEKSEQYNNNILTHIEEIARYCREHMNN